MNKLVQMGAQYGANQLGIQDNPLVKVGLAALDPVSYTHLTLPTILRV